MKTKTILKNLILIVPLLILLTISLLLMYHARYISNIYQNHFKKQLIWYSIGISLILIFKIWKPKKLFDYSILFYIGNVALLLLVLLIGTNVNGAKAWINFKYFSFQPSELMKLSYSLFLANFISQKKFKTWTNELLFLIEIFILFLIPSVLVFLEPDTGAIIFFAIITLVLLWNSNLRKRWFLLLGLLIGIVITGFVYCYIFKKDLLISLIGTSFFYRVERLLDFRNGMQIENALIAIGSAPFYNFSLKKTGIYIPEAPTDFAFALTSNIFGVLGNIIILICFLIIDWWLISFYKKRKNKKEKLFTLSFLSILLLSQIINISMNLGIFPIIGIPLPFISYGGSHEIVLFMYLAILFSWKKET